MIFACDVFLCARNLFVKRKRLEIVLITSLCYTTVIAKKSVARFPKNGVVITEEDTKITEKTVLIYISLKRYSLIIVFIIKIEKVI